VLPALSLTLLLTGPVPQQPRLSDEQIDQVIAYGDAVNAWHMLGKVRTARETQTLTVALVNASSRARQERKKLAAALFTR